MTKLLYLHNSMDAYCYIVEICYKKSEPKICLTIPLPGTTRLAHRVLCDGQQHSGRITWHPHRWHWPQVSSPWQRTCTGRGQYSCIFISSILLIIHIVISYVRGQVSTQFKLLQRNTHHVTYFVPCNYSVGINTFLYPNYTILLFFFMQSSSLKKYLCQYFHNNSIFLKVHLVSY